MFIVVDKTNNETLFTSISWMVCGAWIRNNHPDNRNIEVRTDTGVKVF